MVEFGYSWGWLLALLCQLLLMWIQWSIRKRFASAADLQDLGDSIRKEIRDTSESLTHRTTDLEKRVDKIEVQLDRVPSIEHLHDLRVLVTQVEGTTQRLNERLDGAEKLFGRVETVLNRQEDYLLNKNG